MRQSIVGLKSKQEGLMTFVNCYFGSSETMTSTLFLKHSHFLQTSDLKKKIVFL